MKLCIDCKYGRYEGVWRCFHEFGIDPVDGGGRPCSEMRWLADLCGRGGVFWVRKDKEPDKP